MPPREQRHIGFDARHTTLDPRDLFGRASLVSRSVRSPTHRSPARARPRGVRAWRRRYQAIVARASAA